MNFPIKIKLIDLRYPNVDYILTIKNLRDWQNLKSIEETGNYRVEELATKKRDTAIAWTR